jgi:hypothetical protein
MHGEESNLLPVFFTSPRIVLLSFVFAVLINELDFRPAVSTIGTI